MDMSMFFKFPGILILIGAFLLVVAIIIGVIAYRNVDSEFEEDGEDIENESSNEELNEESDSSNSLKEEPVVENIQEVKDTTEVVEDNDIEQVINSVIDEDVDDDYVVEADTIKEENDALDNEMINKFNNAIDEVEQNNGYIELENVNNESSDSSFGDNQDDILAPYDNSIEQLTSDEYLDNNLYEDEEVVSSNEKREIYGGYNPLDNVKLEFNDEVKKPLYGDENYTPTNAIESGNTAILDTTAVLDSVSVEDEEDIEIL